MDLVPELLHAVKRHLRELRFEMHRVKGATPRGPDWVLTHPASAQEIYLHVTDHLPTTHRLSLPPGQTVVAAPTVTQKQAALLRAAGAVGFIDAAGNASIETDGIYIHIEGRPPNEISQAARLESSRGWAARPSGLQVLFALLTLPGTLSARLSDVAYVAGVSTTTVHRVMNDLTHQGLLDGESQDRYWLDRDGALAAWLEGYTRRVAPNVRESAYISPLQPTEWASWIKTENVTAWVSGGSALSAMGAELRPVATTLYLPAEAPRSGLRLVRPRSGETPNLFVRIAWWSPKTYLPGLAPDLLVYADSLTSGDPRVISTAQAVMRDDANVPPSLARG